MEMVLLSFEECEKSIDESHLEKLYEAVHVCGRGLNGEKTCKGDSGNPVTNLVEGIPYLQGIVTFTDEEECVETQTNTALSGNYDKDVATITQRRSRTGKRHTEDYNYGDTSLNCGKSIMTRQLAFGGTYISRGEYPWHVALLNKGKYFCGATIISNKALLTAAHCIKAKALAHETKHEDIIVLLGVHNHKKTDEVGRKSCKLRNIRIHPDWNIYKENNFDADIAYLELDTVITFNSFIQPICLAGPGSDVENILNGIFVGFGKNENNIIEEVAKKLPIPIVDYHNCSLSEDHKTLISARTFCGGTVDGRGVCDGDSGSGVYVIYNKQMYLRGIVSASLSDQQNCNVNKYAVFTKATDFYDWIKSGGIQRSVSHLFECKNEVARLKELLRRHNINLTFSSSSASSHASSSTSDLGDMYDVRMSGNDDDKEEEVTTSTQRISRFSRTRRTRPPQVTRAPNLDDDY